MERLNTRSCEEIMTTVYKPIEFVVDGLIAKGLYILAGALKVGKSWLSLDICLSIAKGEKVLDHETKCGTTLYLCLEDSFERIQKRLYELTDEPTENLYFAIMADTIGGGLENQIEKFKSEHFDLKIVVRDWLRKKPLYEQKIQTNTDKILTLKQQIEDIIIERIGDREHASIYNSMIAKSEEEIAALEKKIAEFKEYDRVCKQRKEHLKNTTQVLDEILSEGKISDVNLRMLVNKILIHQNEDKSLDIKFEMNGEFNNESSITTIIENQLETA